MHEPLLGETVELRPFVLGDAAAVHAVYSDPQVMRWVGRGPIADAATTDSMVRQYMAHQLAHGFAFWAAIDRATGTLIGDAGLARTAHDEVEMGYTLGRRWWGEGRGTEIASLWVGAAADRLGLRALRALVEAPNTASRRVLEKVGFAQDGTTIAFDREHLVYRLALEPPSR